MIFGMWDQPYFYIGPIPVDHIVVTQWALIAILTVLAALATRKIEMVPRGLQNVLEATVSWTRDFFSILIENKAAAKQCAPFLTTVFIFILVSNYSGLLPGAAAVEGFQPPTSNWNVTLGLALSTAVAVQFFGFRSNGPKYLKRFLNPIAILEEVTHPLSLTVRLFGNIFGEETILGYLLFMAPFFIPTALMGLCLLLGAIQAIVFTLLSANYIGSASGAGH